MSMNGIDISRWNPVDLSKVPCDFVIVKATQGTGYVSPTYKTQIEQADSLGKLLGVYHYASSGGAIAEAKHFLNTVKDYIGKAIMVLDWEGEQNSNFKHPEYALSWLKYVKQETGITPFIYMSKSVCRQYASVWDASYPYGVRSTRTNSRADIKRTLGRMQKGLAHGIVRLYSSIQAKDSLTDIAATLT